MFLLQYAAIKERGISMVNIKTNYYKILNVSTTATQEEIKNAYRTLAKKYHPDSNPTIDTTQEFQKITEAYEVLSDVNKRRSYDSSTMYTQSETVYKSYTKTKEESEFDFDDWINDYLRRKRQKERKFTDDGKWEIEKLKELRETLINRKMRDEYDENYKSYSSKSDKRLQNIWTR